MAAMPTRSQSEDEPRSARPMRRQPGPCEWDPRRPLGPRGCPAGRPAAKISPAGRAPGAGHGPWTSRPPRGPRGRLARAAAVRARRPLAVPRYCARRDRAGAAGARGSHPVRQRLAPAARPERARRGRAARARVRRSGRGPAGAPGAHLRRHGGRGARWRRLLGLLQERPQPLRRRLHRLPHAAPRPQPGAGLPGCEERPPGGRAQPGFLVSAAEVRGGPAVPAPPARGALGTVLRNERRGVPE